MKRYSVVQRHKSRGIKTWYGRIFDMEDGSVQYVSLAVDKKKDAIAWRDRMISDQLTGASSHGESVPVNTAIDTYMKSTNWSDLTVANYASAFIVLREWLSDKRINTLGELNALCATDFISSQSDWKASTKRKRLTLYRTWAKWCMEMYEPGWKSNPFGTVKVKGERSSPRDFWTIEQVEAIIDAAEDEGQKLMYAFMAFAGLRFSEFKSLTLGDIFDDDGNVRKSLRILGKGGKTAFVPICTRLKNQILQTYKPNKNNANFSQFLGAAKGKKIKILSQLNNYQNKLLKSLISRNPILASFGGQVHLHRFRHSFISNLIRANCCSIRCVAELARHENVNITLNTYSHLLQSDKDEALEIFTRKDKNQGGSE